MTKTKGPEEDSLYRGFNIPGDVSVRAVNPRRVHYMESLPILKCHYLRVDCTIIMH